MSGISPTPGDLPYPSVAALFERVVARRPDAPAIESAHRSFTYDGLNRAANRIAHAIVAAYGSDEEPVLLLFGKNALVAAAMLGVLKAGKFYVPLDAADPLARLRLIAQDTGARLVLTDATHEAQSRALAGEAGVSNVEALDPGSNDGNLNLAIALSQPGFLMYTSGSTGTPKGILHSQHSIVKFAIARQAIGIAPETDRTALFYALSVLSSTTIMFGTVLNGSTACIYDLQAQGLAGIAEWLRRERITIYQSTPTVFRHFVATLNGPAALPDLRMITLTGEPVLAHDVTLYQRYFAPPCRLRVGYGSTETRTACDWYADQQTQLAGARVPGGRSWGDVRIHIWDERGQPLPPGETGEVVIQSDMLALGYWRRPELTAQSFLPDPAGGSFRLFRTGDLGTLSSDGLLELCGRKDDQIKIRGNRVEPAEIEEALFALDGVRQTAVVSHSVPGGDARLIAYLVADRSLPDAATLRAQLGARLPAHMLPASFVQVPALPLNAGGKVDRLALSSPAPAGDTAAPVTAVPCAATLFEQVVTRQPEAAAIESAGRSFTYDDLNRVANRIAHAIVAGYGSDEEPVLLLFGKNALVAAAMLGILKAGKFYVPLDAADPMARLRLIAQDAGARLVLTDAAHEAPARALAGDAAVLDVDTIDPGADDCNLNLDIASSRMAYVTYTSGSTGAPKGIQHNQHTLVKTVLVREQLGFSTATDRTALLYSLSVVQSTQYLFAALLNGGAACVYDLQVQGLAGLAEWMRRNQITAFISTPTVYRHFVATLDGRADMPHLRLISLAGEPVLAHDVALYQRCFEAPCRLRISYGSTEAPVSAEWVADQRTRLAQPHAPGGYAWGGSRIFIRDAQGGPLPPGEVGEIVVQSDLLSTGYWRRPELTAQSFLPDPAGGVRRLFRTGDLGTLSLDGLLELYGRKDNQVKIRGHRVEPAEIEDALFALDGVRQAAVLPQAASSGEARLIAYLVSDGALPDAAVLRAQLAARLPAHMLPAVFVRLPSMPVNEAGKVDRRALPPAPELEPSTADPADEAIGRMLAIWREVFGAPVGPDDHFVELGGHSLIAARIVARASVEFGTPVDVTALAQAPTAAQLARWMRSPTPAVLHSVLVLLRAGHARPPFFCVHGFVGGVLDYGPLARHLDADQPFYALQSPAFDGQTPPQDNLVAMATEYASAIRAVQPRGPYRLGGYCFGGVVAFEMARQLRAQGESVALLAVIEGYTPRAAMTPRRWANPRHLAAFAVNLPYWWRDVTRPGARATLGRIVQRWRHAGGSASRVIDDALQGAEVPDTLVHIMQAHVNAMCRYEPASYDGTLTLFRVRGQSLWRAHDPTMGWGRVAASVRIRTIAGTHNTVLAEPDVQSLAASLSNALDDCAA